MSLWKTLSPMTKAPPHSRFMTLDVVRGFAVFLMILFHLAYDLTYTGFLSINFNEDPFWYYFPRFIVFLFLLCVGTGLVLAHSPHIQWPKFWQRLVRLGIYALIISGVTYLIFPGSWIYFGILHCVFVCSFLGIFLVPYPLPSLLVAILILGSHLLFKIMWGRYTLIPLAQWMQVQAMDYIPLYPWFGVVALGIYLARFHWPSWPLPQAWPWPWPMLATLGKHSLLIYLLHQPLLFGFCLALRAALGPAS